jgi:hypothetical protein
LAAAGLSGVFQELLVFGHQGSAPFTCRQVLAHRFWQKISSSCRCITTFQPPHNQTAPKSNSSWLQKTRRSNRWLDCRWLHQSKFHALERTRAIRKTRVTATPPTLEPVNRATKPRSVWGQLCFGSITAIKRCHSLRLITRLGSPKIRVPSDLLTFQDQIGHLRRSRAYAPARLEFQSRTGRQHQQSQHDSRDSTMGFSLAGRVLVEKTH